MKPGLKPGLATAALAALLLTTAAAVSATYWLLERKLVVAGEGRDASPSETLSPGGAPLPVSVFVSGNAR
jgi:hypothetical protein